jgi:CheY-like chemotaxis protein
MPGMNGLEVARRMREDPAARGITLVALTGWGQREDRRRTDEAGFDYHLVKPADLGALQSILATRERASARPRHDPRPRAPRDPRGAARIAPTFAARR